MSEMTDVGGGLRAGASNPDGRRTISDENGQTVAYVHGDVSDRALKKHPTIVALLEGKTAKDLVEPVDETAVSEPASSDSDNTNEPAEEADDE